MDKIIAVAVREFMATVRTRAFILSVVLMPALIVGAIYGTQWVQRLSKKEKVPVRRLAVVDRTGAVMETLTGRIAAHNAESPNQRFELEEVSPDDADSEAFAARVRSGDLYGYAIIAADALELDGRGCELARKDSQLQAGQQLENMISTAIFAVPLKRTASIRCKPPSSGRRSRSPGWTRRPAGRSVAA